MTSIKVKIPAMTVEIDADVWEMNYGIDGAAAIREDVKEAVKHAVFAYLHEVGALIS